LRFTNDLSRFSWGFVSLFVALGWLYGKKLTDVFSWGMICLVMWFFM
jgi:hypothetical protein